MEEVEINSPMRKSSSTSSSFSSKASNNKRKSFEGNENNINILNVSRDNENTPTDAFPEIMQNSAKKFKDALMNGSSQLASAVVKGAQDANVAAMNLRSKSALPRFNILQNKVVKTEMKRIITQHNTEERNGNVKNNETPLKSSRRISINPNGTSVDELAISAATPSSNTNALLKRLKKSVVHTPAGEVIRKQFDTSFSITEERITVILAHMKVKSKWDLKEKLKKYEAVVRELRDCMNITFTEIKTVREQCLIHESHNNNLLRDCYEEFLEMTQSNTILRTENFKIQQEMSKILDETRNTASVMIKYKTEQSPLRNRAKESEQRLVEIQTQLTLEQNKSIQLAADLQKVEKELSELKIKSESSISSQKEDFEQRIEQAVLGYREEVATLRNDLSRRQTEIERFSEGKGEADKKKNELQEEVVRTQSRLREMEGSITRYEKDIDRSAAELERLREQLVLKDADLRSTIISLQEIQKQGSEEKSGMRSDLSLIQARVQQLEEERLSITSQLATKKEESLSQNRDIIQLKEQIIFLESKLSTKEEEVRNNKDSVLQLEVEKELRSRCEVREESERRERIAAMSQLLATQSECSNRIREIQEKNALELHQLQSELDQQIKLKECSVEKCHFQTEKIIGLEIEIQKLHLMLEDASNNAESAQELSKVTGELEVMRRRLIEMQEYQEVNGTLEAQRISEFEEKLRAGEIQRRKLHNLVQELRGNVRVFARVRPFLPSDGLDMTSLPEPSINVRSDINSLKIATHGGEEYNFNFDKVFGPSCSQENLFNEVSEFVQSALDGYNVCLFSYGQTGSGKTHTMQGSGTGSMRGVIPRAMQQVGLYKKELEAKGWEYQMEVSFVEIYNETIKDLLRVGAHDTQHDIKVDRIGNTYLSDVTLTSVDPNNTEQIDKIMEQAAHHRSVGQTAMNERSSRSHSVFALHLKATNASQGINLKGTLNLVDLAGSERLDRSGATGEMLKETVAINKSLSALADVFVAIGNRQSHIPFRNSKLTHLLQPALSGDGKTLMMVNLSPTLESVQESICSLRLAKQINQCELGKPKKQVKDVPSNSNNTSTDVTSRKQQQQSSSLVNKEVTESTTTTTTTRTNNIPTTPGRKTIPNKTSSSNNQTPKVLSKNLGSSTSSNSSVARKTTSTVATSNVITKKAKN